MRVDFIRNLSNFGLKSFSHFLQVVKQRFMSLVYCFNSLVFIFYIRVVICGLFDVIIELFQTHKLMLNMHLINAG